MEIKALDPTKYFTLAQNISRLERLSEIKSPRIQKNQLPALYSRA
jgi:hypothetical protein